MDDHLEVQERLKYEKVWTYQGYRKQADGDPFVDHAYQVMGCRPGESLIDWGMGKGTPAQQFQNKGLKVTGVDIAHNCRDPEVTVPLVVGCLWDPNIAVEAADYSFSTDVLEHLPPERLDEALLNIANHTKRAAYLQVCTMLDRWGALIDPPTVLHLSVLTGNEWLTKVQQLWVNIEAIEGPKKARWRFICRGRR